MKISGFTICQNVIELEYPVVEVIRAALPIVDEFIVNVGPSRDETVQLIRAINSSKVKIVQRDWDESVKKDGLLFSKETNEALSHCTGDWAIYLQADEVLHEQDTDRLVTALGEHLSNDNVVGFVLPFIHFYADYWSTNPWGFHRAVRIVRNNGSVESCGDAVGFRLKLDQGFLQSTHRDKVIRLDVPIYHYGYVKSAKAMQNKARALEQRFHGDQPRQDQIMRLAYDEYEFPEYEVMKEFRGSHPAVMMEQVSGSNRLAVRRSRWLNWRFYREIARRGFRG